MVKHREQELFPLIETNQQLLKELEVVAGELRRRKEELLGQILGGD
jgi:hypothetical protein